MKSMIQTIGKGVGTVASGVAAWEMPTWEQIDHAWRTLGIMAATVGSILFAVSLFFDIRRKWKDRNK